MTCRPRCRTTTAPSVPTHRTFVVEPVSRGRTLYVAVFQCPPVDPRRPSRLNQFPIRTSLTGSDVNWRLRSREGSTVATSRLDVSFSSLQIPEEVPLARERRGVHLCRGAEWRVRSVAGWVGEVVHTRGRRGTTSWRPTPPAPCVVRVGLDARSWTRGRDNVDKTSEVLVSDYK